MLFLSRDSREIRIEFRTDLYDNYKGFSLGVSLNACASSQFACDNQEGCYNVTEACDGTPKCADGSDEMIDYCAPECGVSHFSIAEDHTSDVNRVFGGINIELMK